MLPHMRLDSAANYKSWLLLRRLLLQFGLRFWLRVQAYTSIVAAVILTLVAWTGYAHYGMHSSLAVSLELFALYNVVSLSSVWLAMIFWGQAANQQADVHCAHLAEVQLGLRDTISGSCGLRDNPFVVPEEVIRVVAGTQRSATPAQHAVPLPQAQPGSRAQADCAPTSASSSPPALVPVGPGEVLAVAAGPMAQPADQPSSVIVEAAMPSRSTHDTGAALHGGDGAHDVRDLLPGMFHFSGMDAATGTVGDGYTITLQAQNRLVECDALCTAVTRSVHAADQREPVRILGLRASSTIVRTAFLLLLSGATTVLRAAAA